MVLHGIALSGVFSASDTPAILQIIEDNMDGMILEAACMSAFVQHTEKIGNTIKLFKYRTFDGSHEIDIVVLDYGSGTMHLYEVKRSEGKPDESGSVEYVEDFARKHLTNSACVEPLVERFKPSSVTRTVLYRGEDVDRVVDGCDVKYKNIEGFLEAIESGGEI